MHIGTSPLCRQIKEVGLFVIYSVKTWLRSMRSHALPPGPKGYPIFGNIGDIPDHKPWVKYKDWSICSGSDVVYVHILGRGMVILNSLRATTELLEKKSSIYSDRPPMYMMNDLMGWEWNFANMPYGVRWRRHRRAFHQYFNSNIVVDHCPVQTKQTRVFLQRLAASPDNFISHIRHHSGSIILMLTYGYEIQPDGTDYYVNLVHHALEGVLAAGNPGTYAVDFLPILKYLPSWLPGAEYKRKAARWSEPMLEMRDAPFNSVKEQMKEGTALHCFVSTGLKTSGKDSLLSDEADVVKNAAGLAYLAGSDTTVSAITSFFLAMALHPEIQERAQRDLDAVVGKNRLPTFEDRLDLPYIDCIMREIMRWRPVTPLAVAHRVMEEDVYNGYRIPKGTTVVANSWAILHDESVYKDPMSFRPERFLGECGQQPETDPFTIGAFGFGRRICPGRHLAEGTMWLTMASVLSAFTISKATDLEGREIEPLIEYSSGIVSHPTPFFCSIKPRSEELLKLIKTAGVPE